MYKVVEIEADFQVHQQHKKILKKMSYNPHLETLIYMNAPLFTNRDSPTWTDINYSFGNYNIYGIDEVLPEIHKEIFRESPLTYF